MEVIKTYIVKTPTNTFKKIHETSTGNYFMEVTGTISYLSKERALPLIDLTNEYDPNAQQEKVFNEMFNTLVIVEKVLRVLKLKDSSTYDRVVYAINRAREL